MAYTDKGSGLGPHDLENGTHADTGTAGKGSIFTASLSAEQRAWGRCSALRAVAAQAICNNAVRPKLASQMCMLFVDKP